MIIDIHSHPRLDRRPVRAMAEIIRQAKRFGIDKLCLLGDVLRFGVNPRPDQVKQINDLTIRLVKRWPDILIGFCFLNPTHSKRFIAGEIERCVTGEGCKGIKLEIAVNARDKRLDPIMEQAEELNLVVLHHSWDTTIINNRNHQSDPADIAHLASRFPQVKIIMAHLTGGGMRGVLAVKDLANVYVDTSGSQPFAGLVEYAIAELGAERLLYGSDVPGRDFSCQLGRIYGARIKEKEKQMILGLNAKRILEC